MTEEMIKKFSYDFCSDETSCEYLLNYIKDGRPLDQVQSIHWQMTLDVWLETNSVTKEDLIKWLEKAVELEKALTEKLTEADKLLAECEVIARGASLSFSMPRVSGVTFRVSKWGVGWDRSDYSC